MFRVARFLGGAGHSGASVLKSWLLAAFVAFLCVGCIEKPNDQWSEEPPPPPPPDNPAYTITFNANGGTVSPTSGTTGTNGRLASLLTPTRNGYTFNGWFTAATGNTKVTTSTEFNANTTIYAQWTENSEPPPPPPPNSTTYTITFNLNYTGAPNPTTGTTGTDGRLTSMPTPANRSDHTFDGWFTATAGGRSVTETWTFDANTTVYAQWTYTGGGGGGGGGTTFTDTRDGTTYKKVTIGSQTWMAENLNYNAPGSLCYENSTGNCETYGRLYNWATAMGIDASYNSSSWNGSDVNRRGICPVGWHLPSDAEWTTLTDYVGGSSVAGTMLKSTSGWYKNGNGSDSYGFSALPGGNGNSGFFGAGNFGSWWSATENDAGSAWSRLMYYNYEGVYRLNNGKTSVFAVRCVQD